MDEVVAAWGASIEVEVCGVLEVSSNEIEAFQFVGGIGSSQCGKD